MKKKLRFNQQEPWEHQDKAGKNATQVRRHPWSGRAISKTLTDDTHAPRPILVIDTDRAYYENWRSVDPHLAVRIDADAMDAYVIENNAKNL